MDENSWIDLQKDMGFLNRVGDGWEKIEKPWVLEADMDDYAPIVLVKTHGLNMYVTLSKSESMENRFEAKVRILTENKKDCSETKEATFYRAGEENGLVEYRSYHDDEGILFFLAERNMPSTDRYHVLKVCGTKLRIQVEVE
jgi:hypothetical protein